MPASLTFAKSQHNFLCRLLADTAGPFTCINFLAIDFIGCLGEPVLTDYVFKVPKLDHIVDLEFFWDGIEHLATTVLRVVA